MLRKNIVMLLLASVLLLTSCGGSGAQPIQTGINNAVATAQETIAMHCVNDIIYVTPSFCDGIGIPSYQEGVLKLAAQNPLVNIELLTRLMQISSIVTPATIKVLDANQTVTDVTMAAKISEDALVSEKVAAANAYLESAGEKKTFLEIGHGGYLNIPTGEDADNWIGLGFDLVKQGDTTIHFPDAERIAPYLVAYNTNAESMAANGLRKVNTVISTCAFPVTDSGLTCIDFPSQFVTATNMATDNVVYVSNPWSAVWDVVFEKGMENYAKSINSPMPEGIPMGDFTRYTFSDGSFADVGPISVLRDQAEYKDLFILRSVKTFFEIPDMMETVLTIIWNAPPNP